MRQVPLLRAEIPHSRRELPEAQEGRRRSPSRRRTRSRASIARSSSIAGRCSSIRRTSRRWRSWSRWCAFGSFSPRPAASTTCRNFVIWGWLFGFYLNVISHTAIDDDQLPEIDIGTSITFLLYILGPFFIFFYTLFLVELPFIIGLSLAQDSGVTFGNLWSGSNGLHRLLQALLLGGLFLFPAAILTTAVGGSFSAAPAGLPPGPPAAGLLSLPDHRRPADRRLCPGNAHRPVRSRPRSRQVTVATWA